MGKKFNTILSERDIKIFDIIKKFGCLREDFLSKYLGYDWCDIKVRNVMYSQGKRLSGHEYISRKRIIDGYPSYWSLGKKGAEFINGEELKKISLATLRHNDLATELAIDLLVRMKDTELKTEYELKLDLNGNEAKNKKLPDLIVNRNTAIEIELSRKNDNKITSIVSRYLSSDYESVIYYTDNIGIANKINYISKGNSKFKFRIFSNSQILKHEDYIPELKSISEIARNSNGEFMNSVDDKLRKLGAFRDKNM